MLGQAIDMGQRVAGLVPLPSLLMGTVAAGLAAWAFVWLLQPFANRLGLVDHPHSERKDHGRPTPVTGGLGMILALGLFFLLVPVAMTPARWSFLLGSLVLIMVGLADDIHDLRWWDEAAGLPPGDGFVLDLEDRASACGGLLLAPDGDRLTGWRPERGALTAFREGRMVLSPVVPGAPERRAIVGRLA